MDMTELLDKFNVNKQSLISCAEIYNEAYRDYKLTYVRDVRLLKEIMIRKVMESNAIDD